MDNKKTFEVMLDLVADAWEKEGHTDEAAAIRTGTYVPGELVAWTRQAWETIVKDQESVRPALMLALNQMTNLNATLSGMGMGRTPALIIERISYLIQKGSRLDGPVMKRRFGRNSATPEA